MTNKEPIFAKEADLCAAFIEGVAKEPDWTVYPETAGFDIVLVRKDGIQIGIEAKLTLNSHVVTQALPRWLRYSYYSDEPGPHYRAVLVPEFKVASYLETICSALGITVIKQSLKKERFGGWKGYRTYSPDLPGSSYDDRNWHEWCPSEPCKLPGYVPDVGAGHPAPVALTHWKISAIKLAIILEERPVTRRDFKHLNLSPSRWTDPFTGWLKATETGYVTGPGLPDFKAQHPKNYEQIKADKAKWMPSDIGASPRPSKPTKAVAVSPQGTLPFLNNPSTSTESFTNG